MLCDTWCNLIWKLHSESSCQGVYNLAWSSSKKAIGNILTTFSQLRAALKPGLCGSTGFAFVRAKPVPKAWLAPFLGKISSCRTKALLAKLDTRLVNFPKAWLTVSLAIAFALYTASNLPPCFQLWFCVQTLLHMPICHKLYKPFPTQPVIPSWLSRPQLSLLCPSAISDAVERKILPLLWVNLTNYGQDYMWQLSLTWTYIKNKQQTSNSDRRAVYPEVIW